VEEQHQWTFQQSKAKDTKGTKEKGKYKGKGKGKGKSYGGYKGKGKGNKGHNNGKVPVGQGNPFGYKGQQQNKGKGKGHKGKHAQDVCYRCGQPGHIAKNCRVSVYNYGETPQAAAEQYDMQQWYDDHIRMMDIGGTKALDNMVKMDTNMYNNLHYQQHK